MSNSTKIAVIGGGPGGYVAAIRAAQLGADVTLIEGSKLGGTCLNVGCIPTKALLRCSQLLDGIKNGREFGITAEPNVDFTQVQKYKEKIVNRLVGGVGSLMKANKVTVLNGYASFKDSKTLTVKGENGEAQHVFEKIIIATGSKPAKPPIPGIESPQCVDSTGALSFEKAPESMVIIGGGVIGVELASVYSSFGTKITIVEMEPEILPLMDAELAGMLRKLLTARGINIMVSAKLESIEDRGRTAKVLVSVGDQKTELDAEKILVSVGRRTNTEALSLDSAGVKHDRGRISADDGMRTNVPGIYAVGDCLGRTMLAHVASVQGEIAAENAMGHDAKYKDNTNPSCVYTEPEFASVGLSEREAKKRGVEYVTGRFPMAANGKSIIAGGGEGVVKIMADPKFGEIIGLHILGPHATDLISEGALAIGLEATLDEITSTIHAHPTISEAVCEAALAAKGRAVHIPN
ncbi:MAG: dihydrolipoyl dehydrogenase [Synergistaceae bacterium]|jgi:dihydrolipoamide dehydrogenase|nr:dihydrolipoyl dehydrogenase [Synergistaceae bacterium]